MRNAHRATLLSLGDPTVFVEPPVRSDDSAPVAPSAEPPPAVPQAAEKTPPAEEPVTAAGQAPTERPDVNRGTQGSPPFPGPSAPSAPPEVGVGHNPINIVALGLGQDFGATVGAKKLLRTIPRRTPNGQEFVRVHPTYRFDTMVLKLKADGQTYLVDRPLWSSLSSDLTPTSLVLATNAQGVVFIWPLRLPRSDGRFDDWGRSAQDGAQQAMKSWVKLVASTNLGAYEIYTAAGAIAEPVWPEETFDALLNIAYRAHFIGDLEHPILRQLRGEAT